MQWRYASTFDVSACMARLCDPNIGSVDELNPFRVKITRISGFQVYLVYKGRRFSKDRRTEYLISISPDGSSSGTTITVMFKRDLFNLQYPVTPVSELDTFLKLAINACRKA